MTSAADPIGKITAYTYDPAGNITEITKPGGRKTSYGYDKNYNVTSVQTRWAMLQRQSTIKTIV